MSKPFKTTIFALALAVTFSACGGNKSKESADSSKVDSTTTVKTTTDTVVKADTMAARDTMAGDTALAPAGTPRVDTLKKTVTKTTVVKKQVTQKPN